jgi:hypothetical protein
MSSDDFIVHAIYTFLLVISLCFIISLKIELNYTREELCKYEVQYCSKEELLNILKNDK